LEETTAARALSQLVVSQSIPNVEWLEVYMGGSEVLTTFLQVLGPARLLKMRHLHLGGGAHFLEMDGPTLLGEILKAPVFPNLEALIVARSGCREPHFSILPVIEGLQACGRHKTLQLHRTIVTPESCNAFAHLLGSGLMSNLQHLLLFQYPEPALAEMFVQAMSCRDLRIVQFDRFYGGAESCLAAAAALRDNAWPHMVELDFHCPDSECLVAIAQALSTPGTAWWMVTLAIGGNSSQDYGVGLDHLSTAFLNGSRPSLKQLDLPRFTVSPQHLFSLKASLRGRALVHIF